MSPNDRLDGYAAIAACLSELWAVEVSVHAAKRLATRSHRPLPVDGYFGRVWTSREAVTAWVASERDRRGRTLPDAQLDLLALLDE